jgi:hypothetical protein
MCSPIAKLEQATASIGESFSKPMILGICMYCIELNLLGRCTLSIEVRINPSVTSHFWLVDCIHTESDNTSDTTFFEISKLSNQIKIKLTRILHSGYIDFSRPYFCRHRRVASVVLGRDEIYRENASSGHRWIRIVHGSTGGISSYIFIGAVLAWIYCFIHYLPR